MQTAFQRLNGNVQKGATSNEEVNLVVAIAAVVVADMLESSEVVDEVEVAKVEERVVVVRPPPPKDELNFEGRSGLLARGGLARMCMISILECSRDHGGGICSDR